VTQVDTNSLTAKEVFRTTAEGLKDFGSASTALQLNGQFWIGAVQGDRVAIVPPKH